MFESYVEIDIDKLLFNIKNIRKINPDSMYCAVLKANGYGLGAFKIAEEIEDEVDYFAVARVSEALSLREAGITKPILILGAVYYKDAQKCIDYNIDIPIFDLEYAKIINQNINGKVNAHILLDTGMGRIGFRNFEKDKIKELRQLENINIISVFSHLSTADEADTEYTNEQKEKFIEMTQYIHDEFDLEFVHLANSAGAIKHKITRDMMRVGISTYGLYPSDFLREEKDIELKQCFEFKSRVIFVKEVEEGTSISYGRTFITERPMKIATLSIGYADGYIRAFSNVGEVMINGKLCKVLGRVCMDQMMVDVTDIDVSTDDEVIIYPDIYKESQKIGTIPYELMTSINLRVPRIYKKSGKIISIDNYLGEIYED
ncbi:alanine racemase [Anaerococcus sp. mt242]|uniref:alanine racemase n=1 Tax=Anaerococcus sp. mt242 TaxID=2661917 RepID=UPI0019322D67|nr:alanine racemase [Anaerococcus sp. mt242]MBM0045799.1 alanine racemase [Anaerococcus sp. mt242]